MTDWEILDIKPSADASEIKKAYAKKLKIYHPEDDPEGYQILREAYERVLRSVKQNEINIITYQPDFSLDNNTEERMDKSDVLLYNFESKNTSKHFNDLLNIPDSNTKQELLDEFFVKLNDLYNDFFSRIDESKWIELLNEDIIWQLESKDVISQRMLNFLMDDRYIPNYVWKKLNICFQWDEQMEYLYTNYPEVFVKYLIKQIKDDTVPRYCYFHKDIDIDFAEYVRFREKTLIALLEKDKVKAKENLTLAMNIYTQDPDLYNLKAWYLLECYQSYDANEEFQNVIKFFSNDKFLYLAYAKILFEQKEIKNAIKIIKAYNKKFDESLEMKKLLAICYFRKHKYMKASILFMELFPIETYNREIRNYLQTITKKLSFRSYILYKKEILLNLIKVYDLLGEPVKADALKRAIARWKRYFTTFLFYITQMIVIYSIGILFGTKFSVFLGLLSLRFVLKNNE
jgi:hypothetical protein